MKKYILVALMSLYTTSVFCEAKKNIFIKFITASDEVEIKKNQLQIIGELLDKSIQEGIDFKKFSIMSKENVEVLLPPDTSLEDCDNKCDVAIGRLIQADIVISAKLREGFGKYFIYIEVVNIHTSNLINKISLTAKSLERFISVIERFNFKNSITNRKNIRTGNLTISTNPPSEIFINEKSIGITPIVSYELKEGNHTIDMVTLKGKIKYTNKINIIANQENYKKFVLEKKYKEKELSFFYESKKDEDKVKKENKSRAQELLSSISKRRKKLREKLNPNQLIRFTSRRVNPLRCEKFNISDTSYSLFARIRIYGNGRVNVLGFENKDNITNLSYEKCLKRYLTSIRFPKFKQESQLVNLIFRVEAVKENNSYSDDKNSTSNSDLSFSHKKHHNNSVECPKGMKLVITTRFPRNSIKKNKITGRKGVMLALNGKAYCIDKYEYTSNNTRLPKVNINFNGAKNLCFKSGKRLCTPREWKRACKGTRGSMFPYGKNFDPKKCNTEDSNEEERRIRPSGSFKTCRSSGGVYDMSGNVAEWTSDKRVFGGYYASFDEEASCIDGFRRSPSSRRSYIGFRCCSDFMSRSRSSF